MATSTRTGAPHLAAVAITRSGLPGPALLGRTITQVVVTVTAAGGEVVSGLAPSAFLVSEVCPSPSACALPVEHVGEPSPGVYVLALRGDARAPGSRGEQGRVLVIDVHLPDGTDERTLARVDA